MTLKDLLLSLKVGTSQMRALIFRESQKLELNLYK